MGAYENSIMLMVLDFLGDEFNYGKYWLGITKM